MINPHPLKEIPLMRGRPLPLVSCLAAALIAAGCDSEPKLKVETAKAPTAAAQPAPGAPGTAAAPEAAAPDAEEPLVDQPESDARTARVDAPAALERDRAVVHLAIALLRLVAVGERRIRARG
ncbi:MAG TPA: hypothetical protein PK598_01340, partial [Thermoanaerobaculia bacterium]|nr:hypothetical protein [Thermoanaerobaculia bacterium]